MAPKVNKFVGLQALAAFVREPHKLEELRARDGNNLQEKLRQTVPSEQTWYKFLYNNLFDEMDKRALLGE